MSEDYIPSCEPFATCTNCKTDAPKESGCYTKETVSKGVRYGFKPHTAEPDGGGELWGYLESNPTMIGYVMYASGFELAIDAHEEEMAYEIQALMQEMGL
tara:strand:+ start:313 stop:612 length:300 start_codon:yes stop_codon:yes gene_type:complete